MSGSGGTLRNFFINEEGELCSVLRVLAFCVLFSIAAWLLYFCAVLLSLLCPPLSFLTGGASLSADRLSNHELIALGFGQLVNLAAALAASWACARFLERRSFASIGYKFH